MLRHIKTLSAIAIFVGGLSGAASAATFAVGSAVSDPTVHGGAHDHAVWLPFFERISGTPLFQNADGSDFDFLPGAQFVINDDGSATLSGQIASQVNAGFGFDIFVNFDPLAGPGTGGPKQELRSCAYNGVCADVDTATFTYMSLRDGVFIGEGAFAGLDFSVSERPDNNVFPLQIGDGANNKNLEFGASSWFFLTILDSCSSNFCGSAASFNRLVGDFNLNLIETPLPAGLLLFLTSAAGLGAARRRRA